MRPADYEYRSEQDPGDTRVNALAAEGWEHYSSDRGKLFFRKLKIVSTTDISSTAPPRETFESALPKDRKKTK